MNALNLLTDVNTTSFFAYWTNEDVDIGQYQETFAFNVHNNVIEAGFEAAPLLDRNENIAFIISGFPTAEITKIQSIVYYDRQDCVTFNRTLGLALELYSRENDVNLETPLASSNEISVDRDVYHFDCPSISSYTSASNSTTEIADDTLSLKEVSSCTGSNTSCDTITTTGNATIGGTLNVRGTLSNPNQPCFKVIRTNTSVSCASGENLNFNEAVIDNINAYNNTDF